MDNRNKKFADMIVNYSCRVQKGERVLIEEIGTSAKPLIRELIRAVYKAGGYPYLGLSDASLNREIIMNCSEEQLKFQREYEMYQMKGMDAYIAVRASDNTSELSDVPSDKLNLYSKMLRPVIDERVDHTKWVIMRYPNNSMAQLSNMSLEAFENFYYDVCTLDYAKMSEAMDPLVDLMNRTDKVRIVSPGTDLTFSIKGIPAIKCAGECNIPDGEVYTAPVRDSINGVITYNTPSEYNGFTFENVRLTFKDVAGICSFDRLSAGVQREYFHRFEQPENLLHHKEQVFPIFRVYPGRNERDFTSLLPGTVCRNNCKMV